MVWIHGGGFGSGSGNAAWYGPDYIVQKDVILVTLNYRLGALGTLHTNWIQNCARFASLSFFIIFLNFKPPFSKNLCCMYAVFLK